MERDAGHHPSYDGRINSMRMDFRSPFPPQHVTPRTLDDHAPMGVRKHSLHLTIEPFTLLTNAAEEIFERFPLDRYDRFQTFNGIVSGRKGPRLHLHWC